MQPHSIPPSFPPSLLPLTFFLHFHAPYCTDLHHLPRSKRTYYSVALVSPKRVSWIIATFSFICWASFPFSVWLFSFYTPCSCFFFCSCSIQFLFPHSLFAVSWENRLWSIWIFDVTETSCNLDHLPLGSAGHYFWSFPRRPEPDGSSRGPRKKEAKQTTF